MNFHHHPLVCLQATSPGRERSDERFSVTPCAKMLVVRSRVAIAVFSDVGFYSPWGWLRIGKKVYSLEPRAPAHAFGPNTLSTYTRHKAWCIRKPRQAGKVALLKSEKSIIIALANARNQRIKKCFSFIRRQTSWLCRCGWLWIFDSGALFIAGPQSTLLTFADELIAVCGCMHSYTKICSLIASSVNRASSQIICASETFAFFNHQIACWAVINSKGRALKFRELRKWRDRRRSFWAQNKQGPIDVWGERRVFERPRFWELLTKANACTMAGMPLLLQRLSQ